jgi:hypothetical protein
MVTNEIRYRHRAETDEAGVDLEKDGTPTARGSNHPRAVQSAADDERCRRGANARSTMNDPFGDPLCFVDETSLFTAWLIE